MTGVPYPSTRGRHSSACALSQRFGRTRSVPLGAPRRATGPGRPRAGRLPRSAEEHARPEGRYDAITARADRVIEELRPERFDVVCAGQPLWRGSIPSLGSVVPDRSSAVVNVTRMLTLSGLHVGWAAVLEDDRLGRALLAEVAALDVDVGAVRLAPVGTDLPGKRSSGLIVGLLVAGLVLAAVVGVALHHSHAEAAPQHHGKR
jgi:hypothetical protein